MKKITSYKILCVSIGLGIALAATVVNAASRTKTLEVIYNNIAIVYNGQIKDLTSEPFMVDGTVYAPLYEIGEIMGANLDWTNNTLYINSSEHTDDSSQQEMAAKNFEIANLKKELDLAKQEIETYKNTGVSGNNLTTSPNNSNKPKIYLEDLKVFSTTKAQSLQPTPKVKVWQPTDTDNLGNTYLHGMAISNSIAGWGGMSGGITNTYNIDKKYSKIKGTLVYSSPGSFNSFPNTYAFIKILGDGEVLYASDLIKSDTKPFDFEVDLTGVSSLQIYMETKHVKFGIVNTGLY